MTRRLGKGDAQRGRARLTLTIVTLLATALLLGLAPGGPMTSVLAEVNGTPTATTTETNAPAATATPATQGTAQIELINPTAYVTPVIVSTKGDTDTSYHLVAWVSNPGSLVNPTVEFEITGNNQQQSVPASRVGDSDTWHAFWTVPQADAAGYTVNAKLFGGAPSAPVDNDLQNVTINKTRETVEMTYPTNAGPLGLFDPAGAADIGFVVDATVSADATGVSVFYSTSPPGTEPNWRRCAQQVTVSYSAPGNRRIGCTVASAHFSSDTAAKFELRAVAVVANGTDPFTPVPPSCNPADVDPGPPPVCPTVDSGDAHRVIAYDQVATSVAITPSSANATTNTCQEMTATVLDNLQRPIWRANMDVHAVGPSDGLQFGAIAGRTRDWQPADAAGSHSPNEPTSNCGGMGTPPAQAEHDRPGANDDKHIETKPADQPQGGTDTSGGFPFALRSSVPGITNVEAWADGGAIDNDTRETEPVGTATITWAGPTASQSASQSASATRSPTTSPSATRSPTTSASATGSPTTSSSASGSTTPGSSPTQGGPVARTITLETSKNTVKFGKTVVFSGAIDSSSTGCESGQTVKIQQQTIGAQGFTEIGTAVSSSGGSFAFNHKPAENANYRAVVDPSAQCQEAVSSTRLVLVRVRVGLRASDNRVRKGNKVVFRITVAPCGNHANTDVALERNTGKGFKEIGRKGLNESCQATITKRIRKTARFRARWPSQDDNHEAGTSPTRRVRARG